jgi:hypothetical protein
MTSLRRLTHRLTGRLVDALTQDYDWENSDRKAGLEMLRDNFPRDIVMHQPTLCGMPFQNELGLQYCREPTGHQGPHRDKANEVY